ncbi:MAG TPA: PIG-L family deacetylase [Aggregatilineales bacterium]|nr:PIG-L family deacetylase [Aggregatilineales bacterium]
MNLVDLTPADLRILCVYAHPDDEVFCAGGTVARYAAAGAEVMIVSATPGDAGQIRDANAASRRTLRKVRLQEFSRSCETLGVKHVICWDYGDGTLQDVDFRELTGRIVQIIRSFRPQVVITFGNDGGYGHPDHIAISRAATAACRLSADAGQYTHQITKTQPPYAPDALFHAYFPEKKLMLTDYLVNWLVQQHDRFHGTLEFVNALMLLAEETTMLHYTADHVETRWFPAGFYIIEQGEPATKLYLLLSGEARVVHEAEDGEQHFRDTLVPGDFFGEDGLALNRPRNSHVIAHTSVTCLIFSPMAPTHFDGRGEGAHTGNGETVAEDALIELTSESGAASTCIDVCGYVDRKVQALSQHRTQFPIEPDMFPEQLLRDVFGLEYFVRVIPPPKLSDSLF